MDYAEYYNEIWHGSFEGTAEEFSVLLKRACDTVSNAIFLSGYTAGTVPEIFRENVMNAVCSQIDFIDISGGADALVSERIQSASVGKFSYTSGTSEGSISSLCPLAFSYLIPTGLLYRGI